MLCASRLKAVLWGQTARSALLRCARGYIRLPRSLALTAGRVCPRLLPVNVSASLGAVARPTEGQKEALGGVGEGRWRGGRGPAPCTKSPSVPRRLRHPTRQTGARESCWPPWRPGLRSLVGMAAWAGRDVGAGFGGSWWTWGHPNVVGFQEVRWSGSVFLERASEGVSVGARPRRWVPGGARSAGAWGSCSGGLA